jgi:hypothetical protein
MSDSTVMFKSSTSNVEVFNVTVLPCTIKSPPTVTAPVVVIDVNAPVDSVFPAPIEVFSIPPDASTV